MHLLGDVIPIITASSLIYFRDACHETAEVRDIPLDSQVVENWVAVIFIFARIFKILE